MERQIAVALKYEPERDMAPRVVAKGRGLVALAGGDYRGTGESNSHLFPPQDRAAEPTPPLHLVLPKRAHNGTYVRV